MGHEIRQIRSSCGQVEATIMGVRERAKTLYGVRGGQTPPIHPFYQWSINLTGFLGVLAGLDYCF